LKLFRAVWVADDGSYGGGEIVVLDNYALTEKQLEVLSALPDSDRIGYVKAIMSGLPLDSWESSVE
jgi:predicted 2-oxoglutarate/Fe(II)-dependent dioxygenase YbiX